MSIAQLALDRFDAAAFDLDGVITDTARVHAAAWTELFNGVLPAIAADTAPFDPDIDYRRYVDGKPRADGVSSFLAARSIALPAGTPDDEADRLTIFGLARRKDELFLERLRRDGAPSFPTSVAFVRRLRASGRRVAVVSASRNCREVLELAGLADLFDVVVDGVAAAEHCLAGKPDPAGFQFAARRLGAAPARTLVVEDALAGIEAARRGGFRPIIAIDRHGNADELRRAGAEIVVADLGDVLVDAFNPDVSSGWMVEFDGTPSEAARRTVDALCALGDGTVGVRGDLETGVPGRSWLTLCAGAFGIRADGPGGEMVRLLVGPSLSAIVEPADDADGPHLDAGMTRRVLDLRSGVLACRPAGRGLTIRWFVSLRRPGLVVVRAEGDADQRWSGRLLERPQLEASASLAASFDYREGRLADATQWAETSSDRARVSAIATQRAGHDQAGGWLERLAVFRTGGTNAREEAARTLADASRSRVDELSAEHGQAWAARWETADVEIDGDDRSQRAIRFALFHLLSCAPTCGEAGVGARGLTGLAYSGHVFWDADVFILPMLAAALPDGARAMLEYRTRRLAAARAVAAALGCAGARFPWESADGGEDVTPRCVRDHEGNLVTIVTGTNEEHINADVAWAALHYLDWTGDTSAIADAIRELVTETARYWADRISVDTSRRAHLYGVVGPDEYHEVVDDNAFTNIMVRWHLRKAAAMVDTTSPDEALRWRNLASALVDGYDATTNRHEQFAGFYGLEPLRIADIADVPVAADVLLGRARTAQAQVLKQPDVCMAHHLIPDELPYGSLAADLDFYLPRTSHGSSLSPAVCASLLARAGRPDEAMELFDLAARLDLDDLTGTTGGGLHLATLGGLWQAVVFGFGGVRAVNGVLHVAPSLPSRWRHLRIRLRFREIAIRLDIGHDRIVVEADGLANVSVFGVTACGSAEIVLGRSGWEKR